MAEKDKTDSLASHPLVAKALASRPAVAELIGFNVEEVSDGRAVGCLQAGPQHANPMGTMHGESYAI
jgi:acyl-coenzyme A thioesterase PaaI-like protein